MPPQTSYAVRLYGDLLFNEIFWMNQGLVSPGSMSDAGSNYGADFSLIIPTYNERDNIPELIARLTAVLDGQHWEIIFVDDDSPDDTAGLIRQYAREDPRIRLLHRIGRRGLSTACIEGVLASTASYIGIMDADMQHDETILPRMIQMLRQDSLDLVLGTRNAGGGSMGRFCRARVALSWLGKRISHAVCRCRLSDPMSGFFVFHRSFFSEVVHHLHGGGFKILVDMLACAERPVRFAEVGYVFRERRHGQSKLDVNTAVEYLLLILDKQSRGFLPVRFTAFALIGAIGLVTHLLALTLLLHARKWHFVDAEIAATYLAMAENFFLNNLVTWRDRGLRGIKIVSGLVTFCVACSFGAWASVIFARSLNQYGLNSTLAGAAGIILSLVWNYSVSNLLVWQTPRRTARQTTSPLAAIYKQTTSL